MRLAFIISIAVLTALTSTTNATMILAFRTTLTKDKEPPRKVTVLVADILNTAYECEWDSKKITDAWETFYNKIHGDYYYEGIDADIAKQYESLPSKVSDFGGLLAAFSGDVEPTDNIRKQKPEISALKSDDDKIDLIASLLYNDKEKRPYYAFATVALPNRNVIDLSAVDKLKSNKDSLNLPYASGYGKEVVLNQINTLFGDENAPHTVEQLKDGLRQIFHKLMVFQRKAEYLFASENFSGFAIDDKGQTFLLEDFSNPTDMKPFVEARQKRRVPSVPLTPPNLPYYENPIKPRRCPKENQQKTFTMI